MDISDCVKYCTAAWSEGGAALEGLKEVLRIPNLSPEYDDTFLTNGLINKAVESVQKWIESQGITGLKTTVFADPGREPLLMVEIPASGDVKSSIMTYGHLDKMPPLDAAGWSPGLSAYNPVVKDGKLYARGANDDQYSPFLVLTALKYVQEHKLPHPRIVMLLETGEESGDEEITRYVNDLRERIGQIDVIFVLDAGGEDYSTAWLCGSLRGVCQGVLSVQHLKEPCHSGMATGLVPSTFRIARMLLSRLEDEQTGEIKLKEAHAPTIPQERVDQNVRIAEHLGKQITDICTLVPGARYLSDNISEMVVQRAWKPGLAVTGEEGIPPTACASNVMRTKTDLKLSLRIPPGVDPEVCAAAMKKLLEENPPYGAKVTYTPFSGGKGWCCRPFTPTVDKAITESTKAIFGQPPMILGDGASIPLTNVFQSLWPEAAIIVTGAAGPDSNPHGYDESLNLDYTSKLTAFFSSFISSL